MKWGDNQGVFVRVCVLEYFWMLRGKMRIYPCLSWFGSQLVRGLCLSSVSRAEQSTSSRYHHGYWHHHRGSLYGLRRPWHWPTWRGGYDDDGNGNGNGDGDGNGNGNDDEDDEDDDNDDDDNSHVGVIMLLYCCYILCCCLLLHVPDEIGPTMKQNATMNESQTTISQPIQHPTSTYNRRRRIYKLWWYSDFILLNWLGW